MPEDELTRQTGEGLINFTMRGILHGTWIEGHDSGCVVSLHPCWHHASPYRDEAVPPGVEV